VVAALALGKLVESQFFGSQANDPVVMTLMVCVNICMAMLAAYLPLGAPPELIR
jgi:hypothetical protein